MRQCVVTVARCCAIIAFGASSAYATNFKGVILTTEDELIIAHEFQFDWDRDRGAPNHLIGRLYSNDQPTRQTRIPFSDISRIFIDKVRTRSHPIDVVILLRDERRFKVEVAHFAFCGLHSGENAVCIKTLDPITGEISDEVLSVRGVREIRFDADYGDVRRDEHGRVFPPDYLYSPYTGKQMRLVPIQ